MKKTMLIATALLVSAGTFAFADEAQNQDAKETPRQARFLQDARTEDGKIDLTKALLSDKTPEPMKEALKKADKDSDGFLTPDELKAMRQERFGQRQGHGRRNGRAPQFGQFNPQGGRQFGRPHQFGQPQTLFVNPFQDGKLEIAKLPENTPQQFKDGMKAADKDGDGFLTREELDAMPKPEFPKWDNKDKPEFPKWDNKDKPEFPKWDNKGKPEFPKWDENKAPKFELPKFDFVKEDGNIDVATLTEKVTEAIKKADKNGDGVIDKEEQEAAKKALFEKAAPFMMHAAMMNRAPGFGSHGSQFGKPGFGPHGPQFGKPGFGPQGPHFGNPGFGPHGPQFGKPGFGPQGPHFGNPGFGPQGPHFGNPGFGPQGPHFGNPGFDHKAPQFGKPGDKPKCPGCDNPECKDCKDKKTEQQISEEPKADEEIKAEESKAETEPDVATTESENAAE